MKILLIDDDADFIEFVKRQFSEDNLYFAECHDVKDALKAIETCQPDVIFLDHQLAEGGSEGFEVADSDIAKGRKIYSTTSLDSVFQEYQKRGIEIIKEMDLIERIQSIVDGASQQSGR